MNHGKKTKKKLIAPDISLTLDRSEGSLLSDELDESTELDLDDIETPSDNSNEFEWEGMNELVMTIKTFCLYLLNGLLTLMFAYSYQHCKVFPSSHVSLLAYRNAC